MRVQNRKDVRLPVQLQRAMAAEAEAAREARAKVKPSSKQAGIAMLPCIRKHRNGHITEHHLLCFKL